MARYSVASLLTICLLIAGCGGGGSGTTQQSTPVTVQQQAAPSITGNWDFSATSAVTAGAPGEIAASLTSAGNTFNGSIYAVTSSTVSTAVPINGTITGGNALSATTPTPNSEVLTVSGIVSPDGKSISSGSYNSTGTVVDHGSLTGFMVPSFGGAWTFTTTAAPVLFVAQLTQSATANSDGTYNASGTATLANSQCFGGNTGVSTSLRISNNRIIGASFQALFITGDDNADVFFSGNVDSTGKIITGTFRLSSAINTGCDGITGSATMTR